MKRTWPIEPGSIVRSKAGRDEGRYFAVLSLIDADFAMVADGGLRGVNRQKKKRLKHLYATGETIPDLRTRLEAGQRVEDHELRAWLTAYKQKEA